jgi:hypothetical protein
MSHIAQDLRALLTPHGLQDLPAAVHKHGWHARPDAELFEAACEFVATPINRPLDSFSLHAPLELMARYRLLHDVAYADRPLAVTQLFATALSYAQADHGEALRPPAMPAAIDITSARQRLRQALDEGDVAQAWQASWSLGQWCSGRELCAHLPDLVVPRLGAAGHSVIYFSLLSSLDAGAASHARHFLPHFMMELARQPQARVAPTMLNASSLTNSSAAALPPDEHALRDALTQLMPFVQADAQGIAHTVTQALDAGMAARLQPLLPRCSAHHVEAGLHALQAVCGVSTRAMLEEPFTHAQYGWTHALTLPQALWHLLPGLHEPQAAVFMGALYVAAFRGVLGQAPLPLEAPYAPSAASASTSASASAHQHHTLPERTQALHQSPDAAAHAARHLPAMAHAHAFRTLASEASIRPDAHLVKYVLACKDAAQAAPREAAIYLSAASRLAALWMAEQPPEQLAASLQSR